VTFQAPRWPGGPGKRRPSRAPMAAATGRSGSLFESALTLTSPPRDQPSPRRCRRGVSLLEDEDFPRRQPTPTLPKAAEPPTPEDAGSSRRHAVSHRAQWMSAPSRNERVGCARSSLATGAEAPRRRRREAARAEPRPTVQDRFRRRGLEPERCRPAVTFAVGANVSPRTVSLCTSVVFDKPTPAELVPIDNRARRSSGSQRRRGRKA